MNIVEFQGVSKEFLNGKVALRDVSIALQPDELTFVTGLSGAGKTTFLNLLLGLIRPSSGHIFVNDVNLSSLSRRAMSRYWQGVGTVFQNHTLLAHRSIFENLALPLWVAGKKKHEIRELIRLCLTDVGLHGFEDSFPTQLSTGEQQRAAIARAIISLPRLLVADEPTGNLDAGTANQIIGIFRRYHHAGTTVVIATHNNELYDQDDRVLEIDQGQVLEVNHNHILNPK